MIAQLSHPAYTSRMRVRGWNGRQCAKYCHAPSVARAMLRKLAPEWGIAEHLKLAQYHEGRMRKLDAIWLAVVNRAALETFGRPWEIFDYRVCGIGSDAFAPCHKRVLRHCAYRATEHDALARAHRLAAKKGR